MKSTIFENTGANLVASLRITLVTIALCGGLYPLAIWSFARVAAPDLASGSLVRDQSGNVVGSRLIAQAFTRPEYFWPRPSAVNYDASASGGSNLSPAGPEVRQRAVKSVAAFGADAKRPLPADLVAASGSGLDPDITLEAALWQAPRVAQARAMPLAEVEAEIRRNASQNRPFWSGEGLVNVLALNMALDAMQKAAVR
ncbi:MAG: potassium-transporting ATPase subunit KdpC [Chlorobaculum sp.]|nr:potassium-transporting ATPase subunit KdpC [Chlorobaculum sp.]